MKKKLCMKVSLGGWELRRQSLLDFVKSGTCWPVVGSKRLN